MLLLQDIRRRFSDFLADERGAAGVEFLATLPLLIGALVFTSEYGKALRYRMVLSTATADVARFLAQTPIRESATVTGQFELYDHFINEADAMMSARFGTTVYLKDASQVIAPTITILPDNSGSSDSDDSADTDADVDPEDLRGRLFVTVTTRASVELPLLGFINTTLTWALGFSEIVPDPAAQAARTNQLATSVDMFSAQTAIWNGTFANEEQDCSPMSLSLATCQPTSDGST